MRGRSCCFDQLARRVGAAAVVADTRNRLLVAIASQHRDMLQPFKRMDSHGKGWYGKDQCSVVRFWSHKACRLSYDELKAGIRSMNLGLSKDAIELYICSTDL